MSTPSNMPPKSVGIIISTYNNPEWLQKTLWGYANQSFTGFELIIADDGSGEETRNLIQHFTDTHFPKLKHIWHPDSGFQKSRILNKALLASESEYLIFTDQDCIPRHDFVATHLRFAQAGHFLSGGYFRLPMSISKQIDELDISSGRAFSCSWLKEKGLPYNIKSLKLSKSRIMASIMNAITPARATFNGCNSSGWRADMLKVNGYNEEMHYGGQDREFGERLRNLGLKPKRIRYSAICLHLDHPRPYKNDETMAKNRAIRKNTKENKVVKTPSGIKKGII